MANPSRFLLFITSRISLDQEENHLDEYSVNSSSVNSSDEDSVNSSVESLSDEATSSDDSISTVSSQALTKAESGDLVAADLVNYEDDDVVARDGDEDQDDDVADEDCCYDDEDLDDELIQRSVRKMLKKQRIRKLGKRTFAKVPYTQLKRGCIYGKHGLGIRFKS